MPLPAMVTDLFHYSDAAAVAPGANFTANPNWYSLFGGTRVFFVSGFSEAILAMGLNDRKDLLPEQKINGSVYMAMDDFPSQWRDLISNGHHGRHANGRFSVDQLRCAHEGKPMLLAKIMILLYLLDRHARAKGLDLFDRDGFKLNDNRYKIRVIPAVHYVDTFNNEVWDSLNDAQKRNLHNRTGAIHGGHLFVDIAFKRNLTTYDIANVIFDESSHSPFVVRISSHFTNWRDVRPASRHHRITA